MTDSLEEKINFKYYYYYDFNIGSRQLKDFGQGVGFSTTQEENRINQTQKALLQKLLKKHLP